MLSDSVSRFSDWNHQSSRADRVRLIRTDRPVSRTGLLQAQETLRSGNEIGRVAHDLSPTEQHDVGTLDRRVERIAILRTVINVVDVSSGILLYVQRSPLVAFDKHDS